MQTGNSNENRNVKITMKTQKIIITGLVLTLLSILNIQLSPCHAAPGGLDITFAGKGTSRIGFGGGYAYCSAAVVQSDGKLVMAGNTSDGYSSPHRCALVRYTTDGVFDTTFGDVGVVLTKVSSIPDSSNPNESFNAIGIQANGKIVAAARVSSIRISAVARSSTRWQSNPTAKLWWRDRHQVLPVTLSPWRAIKPTAPRTTPLVAAEK